MFGFEMAYVPVGTYYASASTQVINQGSNDRLTVFVEEKPISIIIDKEEVSPVVKTISVYFPFDSSKPMRPNDVKEKLSSFEGKKVSITGFASPIGSKKYNKLLSQKRAKKIATIAKLIGVDVVSISGVGESGCNTKNPKKYSKCQMVKVGEK